MVSTLIFGAPLGGPDGSQIRGIPIVSGRTSVLPHAMIFPFGIRAMCKGTMSQLTRGPHAPIVAWVESAEMAMLFDVALAVPAVNLMVDEPAPRMPRSTKVARPLALVVAVVVPSRGPEA